MSKTLVQKIYDSALANGFQGTQQDVIDNYSDALNENDPIVTCKFVYQYISSNGYNLSLKAFENDYFQRWIGTRPKGR